MSFTVADVYTPALVASRHRFAGSSTLNAVLGAVSDSDRLERFLICFCALGVQMTRPVEGWIDRAGARCVDLGLVELGEALRTHARHEADHHLMMIDDTRTLVARRNRRLGTHLAADELLATPQLLESNST